MKRIFFSCLLTGLSLSMHAQTLVFHTSFDNGAAQDLSGNGFHGTLNNGPTAAAGFTGAPNTALHFDGVDDFVTLPANAAFNLTTWTIQTMVRFDAFNTTTCQSNVLVWHGIEGGSNGYALFVNDNFYDGSCAVSTPTQEAFGAFAAGSSPTPDFISNWYNINGHVQAGPPAATRWYCVTATYDGATLRIYVDGTLVESGAWANNYNYGTGTAITYIGRSNYSGIFRYFLNGTLDQVSIWSGAMAGLTIEAFCKQTRGNAWRQSNPDEKAGEEIIEDVDIVKTANTEIGISPVPAIEEIVVSIPSFWSNGKVSIMNGVGQVLMEETVKGTQHTIRINDLPMGIYMLRIVKGSESKVEKFIKN